MPDDRFRTTADLRAAGETIQSVRDGIAAGRLERVIRGWYALPGADRDAVRAMRLGGRLGCVSALALHGAWSPPERGMHLVLPSHASGRRLTMRGLPDLAVPHWHPKAAASGSAFAVAPIGLAVEHLLVCEEPRFVVAVLDSLLQRRMIGSNRLAAIMAAGPQRTRPLLHHLDPRAESGIESLVRFGLAVAGLPCRVQVVLRDRSRVDLMVDDWLVIEVDGREWHTGERFAHDQVRAATIMRDGLLVVRFAYATVVYDWDFVVDTVRDLTTQYAPIRTRREHVSRLHPLRQAMNAGSGLPR